MIRTTYVELVRIYDPSDFGNSADKLYEESKLGKLTVWLNPPMSAFWTRR